MNIKFNAYQVDRPYNVRGEVWWNYLVH
jgi:hypothetical protein